MTLLSALFMIWLSTSFFTPYIAIYVVNMLASFVNIKNNQLTTIYNIETNEITEPEYFFEYFVAYQELIPVYMIFGPVAIILSAGHIILSAIFFIPYYINKYIFNKYIIIPGRRSNCIFYIEELSTKF
jgi:hypothetical protein